MSKVFGNSADEYLKVHQLGRTEADVTEGSGGVWEAAPLPLVRSEPCRPHDDHSNIWGGASGHTYNFTRQANGTTEIDVDVVREGKNLKGQLLGFVLGPSVKGVLEKAFVNSVKAIEARNDAAGERIRE